MAAPPVGDVAFIARFTITTPRVSPASPQPTATYWLLQLGSHLYDHRAANIFDAAVAARGRRIHWISNKIHAKMHELGYILKFINQLNKLLVLSVVKIWNKLSRIRVLNSCPWNPKLACASQSLYPLSHEHQRQELFSGPIYTTLYSKTCITCILHHAATAASKI